VAWRTMNSGWCLWSVPLHIGFRKRPDCMRCDLTVAVRTIPAPEKLSHKTNFLQYETVLAWQCRGEGSYKSSLCTIEVDLHPLKERHPKRSSNTWDVAVPYLGSLPATVLSNALYADNSSSLSVTCVALLADQSTDVVKTLSPLWVDDQIHPASVRQLLVSRTVISSVRVRRIRNLSGMFLGWGKSGQVVVLYWYFGPSCVLWFVSSCVTNCHLGFSGF